MRSSCLWIIGVGVLLGCSPKEKGDGPIRLPYYSEATFTPEWIDSDDSRIADIPAIASFSFSNQEGELITDESLKGKIYVANFFFTICPSVCPRMTKNLERIQTAFAEDTSVLLVSHTVMPWLDSVEVLKEYAVNHGIKSGKWHLLTGPKNEIYTLARQSYFADEGFGKSVTDESDFLHTENIFLIDQSLHIRGVYNGTLPLEMARIIEDIERLK